MKTIAHPVKLDIMGILEQYEPLDVSSICDYIGAKMRNIYDVSSSF